jgi:threonine/homoserine/homoserine lactone efflux protein
MYAWSEFVNLSFLPALFFVHWAAVITPGANFLIVSNHALAYSRRAGLMTVRGVVTGSTFYVFSGIIGFTVMISQSPALIIVLRIVGAIYFTYMGIGLIRAGVNPPPAKNAAQNPASFALTDQHAYRIGLMTALANPASALYFLSLFTTFIPLSAVAIEKVITGAMLLTITLVWYTFLALTCSSARFQGFYRHSERGMKVVFGLVWLALALKLATGA